MDIGVRVDERNGLSSFNEISGTSRLYLFTTNTEVVWQKRSYQNVQKW